MTTREVVFLVFDGVKQLDVAGPAEVFAESVRLGASYRLRYVSVSGEAARTSIGSLFGVDGTVADVANADIVIIPGGDDLPIKPIPAGLIEATEHLHRVGTTVASVCTGTFLLAAAGVLNGRNVTTHWAHTDLLSRIYPEITVDPNAIFVRDGDLYTSAGVTSGIDLALALVEADYGAELAREVARRLVVYMQRPGGQSQYSAFTVSTRTTQQSVRLVIDTVSAHPARDYGLDDLAHIANVSARHLARLFRTELNMTPFQFVEQARLEHAKNLLLRGESVSAVARATGFQNPETMRRMFVAHTGVPPSQYQQRFATASRASA